MIRIGHVRELRRYPVKSMAGMKTESALLGLHGMEGDRRFAFRRIGDESGFPWLTASRLPDLLLYKPDGVDESSDASLPTHVLAPDGRRFELSGSDLRSEITARFGKDVELMYLKNGIFDDAAISIISSATISQVCGDAGVSSDERRFRPNVVLDGVADQPFLENDWIGGRLVFGEDDGGAVVAVTARDIRCMMVNLDPDTATQNASVLKATVRANDTCAGVYGTVVRAGTLRVGQPVNLVTD